MRKINILGTAGPSLADIPWGNGDEMWGLAFYPTHAKCDRIFEVHNPAYFPMRKEKTYHKRLKSLGMPVWTPEENQHFYRWTEPIPARAILEKFPNGRLSSSLSYMAAMVVWEHTHGKKVSHVGVYGCDMAGDDEYYMQRPSLAYWLGWMDGNGIEVYIPESCKLMFPDHLYGVEEEPVFHVPESSDQRVKGLTAAMVGHTGTKEEFWEMSGALKLLKRQLNQTSFARRGGDVPGQFGDV